MENSENAPGFFPADAGPVDPRPSEKKSARVSGDLHGCPEINRVMGLEFFCELLAGHSAGHSWQALPADPATRDDRIMAEAELDRRLASGFESPSRLREEFLRRAEPDAPYNGTMIDPTPLDQRTAAEAHRRAWELAEAAEVALVQSDYAEATAHAAVSRAWSAVAEISPFAEFEDGTGELTPLKPSSTPIASTVPGMPDPAATAVIERETSMEYNERINGELRKWHAAQPLPQRTMPRPPVVEGPIGYELDDTIVLNYPTHEPLNGPTNAQPGANGVCVRCLASIHVNMFGVWLADGSGGSVRCVAR